MSIIENTCKKISNKIAEELKLDLQKAAVVRYGMFGIIQTTIAILMIIIVGSIFKVMKSALVLSVVAAILRKYSGGVHARTPESCAIIGTVVSVSGALIATNIKWGIGSIVTSGIIVFIMAIYLVKKLAPIDTKEKPINKAEKRQLLRKKSIFILYMYLTVVVILMGLYIMYESKKILVYIICIYLGIMWQIFTLTKIGNKCIKRIDIFL